MTPFDSRKSLGKEAVDEYLPDFAELARHLPVLATGNEEPITVPAGFIRFLLSQIAAHASFDPDYYLRTNPDVARAYQAGQIETPHAHFVETGYFEGRRGRPRHVDSTWYMRTYPDVAEAYRRGLIRDLGQHYNETGHKEGRTGSAFQHTMREAWRRQLDSVSRPAAKATAPGKVAG